MEFRAYVFETFYRKALLFYKVRRVARRVLRNPWPHYNVP